MNEEALGNVKTAGGENMLDLLMAAHPVVMAVLIILAIASIWSWTVIIAKSFSIGKARKLAHEFEDAFWGGRADEFEIRPGQTPVGAGPKLFASISREWRDAKGASSDAQAAIVDRAERSLRATVDREVAAVSGGLGTLATIGSSSPFIGLFGTVWGIMIAFLNISVEEDTSLAVVGGPIAEALFATGLGLVAAIPAVIFYNKFSGDVNKYADALDSFSQDLLVRLSRRSDRHGGQ